MDIYEVVFYNTSERRFFSDLSRARRELWRSYVNNILKLPQQDVTNQEIINYCFETMEELIEEEMISDVGYIECHYLNIQSV